MLYTAPLSHHLPRSSPGHKNIMGLLRSCLYVALVVEIYINTQCGYCVAVSFNLYFLYLFGVLRRFQHCTGHITTGSWKGRGNQYIQFVRVLYCKLPTNGKQLPAFPLQAVTGIQPRPQRWEARVSVSFKCLIIVAVL